VLVVPAYGLVLWIDAAIQRIARAAQVIIVAHVCEASSKQEFIVADAMALVLRFVALDIGQKL
jgi:hypothetical protein